MSVWRKGLPLSQTGVGNLLSPILGVAEIGRVVRILPAQWYRLLRRNDGITGRSFLPFLGTIRIVQKASAQLSGANLALHQRNGNRLTHHLGIFGLQIKQVRLMRGRVPVAAGFADNKGCKAILQRIQRRRPNTA